MEEQRGHDDPIEEMNRRFDRLAIAIGTASHVLASKRDDSDQCDHDWGGVGLIDRKPGGLKAIVEQCPWCKKYRTVGRNDVEWAD